MLDARMPGSHTPGSSTQNFQEPEEVTGGGLIPWFSVSLSIHSDDLDPDEVTRVLGVEPDQTQCKGVPLPPRGDRPPRVPQIGMWLIHLRPEQAPECDVQTAIARVLDQITVPLDVWHQARAGASARIFVGLFLDDYNRGFGIDPPLLRRAADLGVSLDFDFYNNADDEPSDAGTVFP
jgi:hypothetical protein